MFLKEMNKYWNQEKADRLSEKAPNATLINQFGKFRFYSGTIEESKEICSDYVAYYVALLGFNKEIALPENMNTEIFSFNEFDNKINKRFPHVEKGESYLETPKIIYDDGRIQEAGKVRMITYKI